MLNDKPTLMCYMVSTTVIKKVIWFQIQFRYDASPSLVYLLTIGGKYQMSISYKPQPTGELMIRVFMVAYTCTVHELVRVCCTLLVKIVSHEAKLRQVSNLVHTVDAS